MSFEWQCPYCNHHTTILHTNFTAINSDLHIENKSGVRRLRVEWIVCPNTECKNYTLIACLFELKYSNSKGSWVQGELLRYFDLIPGSTAKVFPEYIPQAILDDYKEACAISLLSPKASATLARRCLQGMIRDFWKVKKNRLVDEINAIEDKIDPLTWQSIDAVRKIGNIGAHMEKDIDLIIDVEPNEAILLINLIELLINDWYINRFEREKKLNKLIEISKQKEEDKKSNDDLKQE